MQTTRSTVTGNCVRIAFALVLISMCGFVLRAQQVGPALYKGMQWRSIGPFRGGRVLAVTGVPGDPETFYFGGVGSGVWKTTNGGADWTPLFDKEPVSSIGGIAVATSDPNVIYVGTGEGCIRSTSSFGDGVYKSTDAGKTWTNIGLQDSRQIGRVIVDPHDANTVFVAALGHEFGPNTERGVFRTTDGGKSWQRVLYKDDKTGAIDVAFDPTNSHILFAAMWEANRTPWGMTDGGPGSGLYKSTDGGATWKHLEGNGLPKGVLGKIGVSVSGGDGNRVYALIEAQDGGLYRSDDGGEKWMRISEDRNLVHRSWYYMHVFADPKNADTLYVLSVRSYKSIDGGKTFQQIHPPHGDNHGLWIDPTDTQRLILGNDGGATISYDGAKTWTRQDSQPTAQFYHVATDNAFPYRVYGAQQDNSTVGISSRGESGPIGRQDWYPVGGGESGYIAPDPRDPNIVYASGYMGEITRFDRRTGQAQEVGEAADLTDGEGAAKLKYRFQWTSPVVLSPQDPNVIYHGAQVLLKSSDAGMNWTAISPDLTRNDKAKQAIAGGPVTLEDTGAEIYDTIFSIAPSKLQKGLIWVGTDDGLVQVTRDDGKNWADVTPKDIPAFSRFSLIEASPHNPGTAYVAYDRHQNDDYKPYIFKTSDFGKTWTKLTTGIPDGNFVRVVREDPAKQGLLYAGTETGAMVSFDDGAHWQTLQQNLPTVPVHDLTVKDNDLIAATHGRSFWILDDVTPLRQISTDLVKAPAHLYTPALAYRVDSGRSFPVHGPYGQNPPGGAVIDYYLKSAPGEKDEVTVEILDAHGQTVRKFSNHAKPEASSEPNPPADAANKGPNHLPADAGMNRLVWDLRYEPVPWIGGYTKSEYEEGLTGPEVVPGTYRVRFTSGGKTEEASLELKPDPRISTSQADLEKQFDLRMKIYRQLCSITASVNQLRDLRSQLAGIDHRLENDAPRKDIRTAAGDLTKKIDPVEANLINPKLKGTQDSLNFGNGLDGKLAILAMTVESADTPPTQREIELFDELQPQVEASLAGSRELMTKDVAAFNQLARRGGLDALLLPPASGASAPSTATGARN